ncbi:hypothetical protein [Alkalibacter saccharofermentans]|uniref:Uncharacterized protein n=1 Tax=Alkalibacter saccharofermentans DSM 14828 TaxID=1120975 RepID=A0A1M4SGG6_9FIRM|nr:hypothetical protein [Alkalibacter saccharofermentans]SHE31285.1 hypothetical protein SAMN02746064_00253 [Alkalibacter saccharofermentans DSM 14828]
MGFIDDFNRKANEAAKKVGEKSEELIESGKIRIEIEKAELKLGRIYKELGNKLYILYKEGEIAVDERLIEHCNKIDDLKEKIEDLESKKA